MDKSFADVQDRYAEWAQTRHLPRTTTPPTATQGYALRIMEEALAEAEAQNATLCQTLAALQHDYTIAAHDRSRLRAQLAQERKKRVRWYETPLAVAVNVWVTLTGETRHDRTTALACLLCVAIFAATLLLGPGAR